MDKKDTSKSGHFADDKTKAKDMGKQGGQASGGNAGGQTRKPEGKPDAGRKPSGGGRS